MSSTIDSRIQNSDPLGPLGPESGRGAEWIDCQVMTPTVKSLGAVEVERSEFMQLLQEAISREIRLFAD